MKKETVLQIICAIFVLLWVYTAASKLSDTREFYKQLYNQVLSRWKATTLFYLVPATELTTAGLLIKTNTRIYGLALSLVLMLIFTAYVGLIHFGYFQRTPCNCGGVISAMDWQTHFYFNVLFTAIAGTGCILTLKRKEEPA